ncbi:MULTISPECIES: 50S ribosomal protein L11 [Nocardia]|uniref:Large ribosomal subunit protein uL11 n=1 Tax=Nocardia arthritidis TaxID=228602 RepID=A0A6G9YQT9_9NOCA|nr:MULTISPECIES: 50S ribosomal protein L11 [Nocardia]QIS15558.1 50S ribosomal protein L11 [Nocardia arthritidis]
MPPKKKKVSVVVTLNLEAGNAAMVDLGKMLGPTGVKTIDIKKEYDAATAQQRGEVIPAVVTVFEDRSYELRLKTPPTSFLIRKAIGANSGSARPGNATVGTLTAEQLKSIAQRKMVDLNTESLEAAMKTVAGTARSMGVKVEA